MGFVTEALFVFVLGFLMLGPKKLPAIIGHIARVKAQLNKATQSFTTELDAALEPHRQQPDTGFHAVTDGPQ